MAVARAALLKPLKEIPLTINQRALVIGGGVAGMNAALNLADQGYDTVIVEKEPELGGNVRKLYHTIQGEDVQKYLVGLIRRVEAHERDPGPHQRPGGGFQRLQGELRPRK